MVKINQKIEIAPYPGFQKGLNNILVKHLKPVKQQITQILGVKNPVSFQRYRRGLSEPSKSKAEAIERLFKQYGVDDPWGPR